MELTTSVEITQEGRGGGVTYLLGDKRLSFSWEFGGGNTLALIFAPDEGNWEQQTGTPIAMRQDILHDLARKVIAQKAQGCVFRIAGQVIEICRT